MTQEKLNGVYTYNNNISNILVNKEITSPQLHAKILCKESREAYIHCEGSEVHKFKRILTCKKRTCPACQSDRKRRLFRIYNPIVNDWKITEELQPQFLTITCKNVQDLDIQYEDRISKKGRRSIKKYSNHIKKYDHYLELLIRRLQSKFKVFNFGFRNKECEHHEVGDKYYEWNETFTKKVHKGKFYTEINAGYHYHFHILFYGKKLDLRQEEQNISKIWKEITKGESYYVQIKPIKFNTLDIEVKVIKNE